MAMDLSHGASCSHLPVLLCLGPLCVPSLHLRRLRLRPHLAESSLTKSLLPEFLQAESLLPESLLAECLRAESLLGQSLLAEFLLPGCLRLRLLLPEFALPHGLGLSYLLPRWIPRDRLHLRLGKLQLSSFMNLEPLL